MSDDGKSAAFFVQPFDVYNQLSNNGNLAIYLSIARRERLRSDEIIHFYSHAFFPAPRTLPTRMSSAFFRVFATAKIFTSWWDLIFFLLLFPAYVCKMHLWLFRESTFWWHAARSECFFFILRFSLVEKEQRKRAICNGNECERHKKSDRDSTHTATAASHCEKTSRLSSQECMHGKNNIYGNN